MDDIPRMPPVLTVGQLVALLSAYAGELPVLLEGDGNQITGVVKQDTVLEAH